ncbi:hypothetical protein CVT24_010012 [Panaeolus cyanescens]|uniref:SH3 domain-containing protein n=1 Tax=Panaeolus cyanescens TaxID=181874 RepID=A0A409VY46_9AGAR|nr:hypothetical protein CVT24_010012 [Panaeolus cyanescens]
MPAFVQNALSPRSDTSNSASNPIYIAGIIVAAVIALGASIWLGVRWIRKRAAKKREEKVNGAFLSVKGLVREDSLDSSMIDKEEDVFANLQRSHTKNGAFSRDNLNSSIVLPDKVHPRRQTREEIVAYHRQSGILPKPFSFAMGNGNHRGSYFDTSDKEPESARSSFMSLSPPPSIGSAGRRFSVMSQSSSFDAVTSTTGTTRKVRQLFDPVLPDELLLARLGETLTVVQSFDDGWCLVGREGSSTLQIPKSLFKKEEPSQSPDVELGCIPAWCFLKPVKGLRAERPVRSTSLGITVKMEAPGVASRHELVSWANF